MEIEVITKTDLTDVEGLENLVDEIKAKAEEAVELNIEIGQVTSDLEEATAEVERLQTELANIELGVSDADFSEVTSQLDEAESKVEELSSQLDELNSKTVSIDFDTSGFDEAAGKAEETASSMDNITTAMAGIAATAGIEQMVTTADNINNSWNRLELTFANTGVSMDTLKDKSSALSDATGRSGGTIRDYFNQMGIAGVTNTDLLTSSFEALSGKAYQTNQSIEAMESKMQMMAMTGNASGRMLKSLGITADDLAKAMGVSAEEVSEAFKAMTPEERIAAITKAMGDGKEANEMYKNSYQGLKDRADAAMAGLMGAIGQAILPVVIPALQAATNAIKMLTDGFKNLPGPVQAVIGGIGGMIAVITAAVGVLGVIGNVIGGVIGGFRSLKEAAKITGIADKLSPLKTALIDVGKSAKDAALKVVELGKKALIAGANAVKSAAMWAIENGMKIVSAGASYALAAAQTILNAVMSMNPIMLVVIAIAALVAALIWAYNNVDWFREMVDNAWQKLQEFGGYIMGALTGAVQWLGDAFNNAGQTIQSSIQGAVDFVMGALQGLWNYIMTLGGLIPENASITGNGVIDAILKVMAFIATLPAQIGMFLINTIAQALGFGDNFTQTMIQGAADAVSGFLEWIGQLPVQVEENLMAVVNSTVTWLTSLWQSITEITLQIAEALAFPFVNIGMIVYESLMTVWTSITGILAMVWTSILTFGTNLVTTVMNVVTSVITNFMRGLTYIASLPGQIAGYLAQIISRVVSWGASLVSNFLSAASKSASDFASQISQIPSTLASELGSALDKVDEWAATLPAKFWEAGVNAVKNFLSALGIASPGTMQRMLVWEVTEMGKRVPEESRQLLSNVSKLGTDIVDEFGHPTLGVGYDDNINASVLNSLSGSSGNQTINLSVEVGSVDDEKRIDEIVEAVRRELSWNNVTAGRSI